MYSDRLREHFHTRADAGKLEDATHYGEAGTPGQGPFIQLWLRVVDGLVEIARFKTYGCPAAIACAEAGAAWAEGKALAEVWNATTDELAALVGGVPEGKEHGPDLAATSLKSCH